MSATLSALPAVGDAAMNSEFDWAMLPQYGCGILTGLGLVVMFCNTVSYARLIRSIRRESYAAHLTSGAAVHSSLIFMVIFLIGYVVGTVDLFIHQVEPMYMFVAVIFFLGSLYLALLLRVQRNMLKSLRDKNAELMTSYVNSIEMKDMYTKGHSRHVCQVVALFYDYLPQDLQDRLNRPKLLDAALLHDIGKMSVDDHILKKSGTLTSEEWDVIKTHTANGRRMLDGTCFVEIGDWVLYHHERMDGQGYHGLAGPDIPLEARIITIADTYSALATDRAYRSRRPYEQIRFIMKAVAGTQLDRHLTDLFFSIPRNELEALSI